MLFVSLRRSYRSIGSECVVGIQYGRLHRDPGRGGRDVMLGDRNRNGWTRCSIQWNHRPVKAASQARQWP